MKINVVQIFILLTLYSCDTLILDNVETKPAVGTIINGKKEGEWKCYYTNGQIAKVEHYRNDTLDGQVLYYDPKGNLKGEKSYRMGVQVGTSKMYFSNGQANLEEKKDSNGNRQGLFKVYHSNGQISQIGYMKNNTLDDTCKTFYDNGQLKEIEYYKDTKKEGTWYYFSEKGKLMRTEIYKNDSLINSTE